MIYTKKLNNFIKLRINGQLYKTYTLYSNTVIQSNEQNVRWHLIRGKTTLTILNPQPIVKWRSIVVDPIDVFRYNFYSQSEACSRNSSIRMIHEKSLKIGFL